MYVVGTDWHFNDETIGKENVPLSYLIGFLEEIENLIKKEKIKTLKLVFSEMIDLLCSAHWLYRIRKNEYHYQKRGVRPWSEDKKKVYKKASRILEETLSQPIVKHFFEYFGHFRESIEIPVEVHFIPGNHGRLFFLYPTLRKRLTQAFGMEEGKDFFFLDNLIDERIGLFVCHGHEFDHLFFEPHKEKAPIGEVITLELLYRLPIEILIKTKNLTLAQYLAQIEGVRPLVAGKKFAKRALEKAQLEKKLEELYEEIIQEIEENFFQIPFVKKWLENQILPDSKITLRYRLINPLIGVLRFLFGRSEFDRQILKLFKIFAFELRNRRNSNQKLELKSEFLVKGKKFNYFVIGHTHNFELSNLSKDSYYINLGTWMPLFQYQRLGFKFQKQRNLAYGIFYEPGEGEDSKYEIKQREISEEF